MAETNQPRKLYGFDTSWHLGEITEYDVVKETEKTYVITNTKVLPDGRRFTNTVRKSEMSLYDKRLATSYAEAVEMLKQFLYQRIARNRAKIEYINVDCERCAELLKEIEEGGKK